MLADGRRALRPSAASLHALINQLLIDSTGAVEALRAWLAARDESSAADEYLIALKDESERLLVVDPAAAAVLADALVSAATRFDKPRYRALGLLAQGDVRRAQGRYAEAVKLLDAAGEAFLALDDEIGWARSRTGWVFASQFCGRGREALPVAERAYAILAGHDEHLRAGSLSVNTAGVHHQLGEYQQALLVYDRAIWHFRQVAPGLRTVADERIAKAMANKALSLILLGQFELAIDLCQTAHDMFIQCGEFALALRVDHFRASIHAGQGQYTRAMKVQADALAAFERAGLYESAIEVTLDMIDSQTGLNRHADALALAEDLIQRCESVGASTQAAKARFRAARALVALGDVRAAESQLELADNALSSAGLSADLGAVTLLRARLRVQEEEWTLAGGLADRAFELFAQHGLVEARTQAELVRARVLLGLGQPEEATRLAQSALGASRALDALPLSHSAHHVLARAAEVQHQPRRALDEYEAAIKELEQVQSFLATELRTEFLGDKLHVFHDAIDVCIRNHEPARGLDFLERAKSRALVDYLASRPYRDVKPTTGPESELMEELRQLRDEHSWFYGRLHGTGSASPGQPLLETERSTLQQAVTDRERRIAQVHERLALLRHAYGLESLGTSVRKAPAELPQLADDTILLEYVFREDNGAVFIVSPSGVTVEPLATGTRQIQRILNRWYLNLGSCARAVRQHEPLDGLTQNANGLLGKLYRALVEPVGTYLEGVARVVVVPYSAAHGIPFNALFDGRNYLVERMEVWTTPSSNILNLCAQRARRELGSALVMGCSRGRLPGVVAEARRVAELLGAAAYLETDATRRVVLTDGPRHNVLHLAAHGEARLDNPTFAHLSLADGELSMEDIVNLRLDGALVTLSACETGRSVVLGGDELVGLSRGFLFAGASTLVQSLWRVEDLSTASLMERFYTALLGGYTPGAALRSAQCSVLQSGAHPYTWAPFQVVGYGG